MKWAERRHPTKRRDWVWKTYFTAGRVRGFLSKKFSTLKSEKTKYIVYIRFAIRRLSGM